MAPSRSQPRPSKSRKGLTAILVATLVLGVGFGGYHFIGQGKSEDSNRSSLKSSQTFPQQKSSEGTGQVSGSPNKSGGIAETAQNWFEKATDSKSSNGGGSQSQGSSGSKSQNQSPLGSFRYQGQKEKIHSGKNLAKKSKKRSAKKALGHKKKSHKSSKYAKKSSKSSKHSKKVAKKSKHSLKKQKSLAKKHHGKKHNSKKMVSYHKQAKKTAP